MIDGLNLLYIKLVSGEDIIGNAIYEDDGVIEVQDCLQIIKSHGENDRYSYYMKEWMSFANDNIVGVSRCNIVAQAEGTDELLRFYVIALSKIVTKELHEATDDDDEIMESMEVAPKGVTRH